MATTNFVTGTVISSDWLNDVDEAVYTSLPAHIADTTDAHAASAIGYLQAGTGAVARTAQNKMREQVSVLDFGALGNGVANDAAAIALANTAAASGGVVYPAGVYYIDTNTTLTSPVTMMPGARFKVNAGKTLTINAPVYAGSRQYIFEGASGAVTGTMGDVPLWVDWFGAVPDCVYGASPTGTDSGPAINRAIVAANNGASKYGVVKFNAGKYLVDTAITSGTSGVTIEGAGQYISFLICKAGFASTVITMGGAGGPPSILKGFGVIAATGGAYTSIGIQANTNGVFMSDFWISGFNYGIVMNNSDQFLDNFVTEYCNYGLIVNTQHTTISNGLTYLSVNSGVLVQNAAAQGGTVMFSNMRSDADVATGYTVLNSQDVSFTGCSVSHINNSQYSSYGWSITGSSARITLTGCTAALGTQSTTATAFHISGATSVTLNNCVSQNFNKGVYIDASTPSNITISGGIFDNSYTHGIHALDYNFLTINGVGCHNDGSAAAGDSGIMITANRADQRLNITGCNCATTGSGTQDYGIRVTCTDANSKGLVTGCIAVFNNTGQITIDGASAANITTANNLTT